MQMNSNLVFFLVSYGVYLLGIPVLGEECHKSSELLSYGTVTARFDKEPFRAQSDGAASSSLID